jgi:peptidoglycan/LPS O-acetylase OafA/YrhL
METNESRYPRPETGGALARRTALGVLVAVVAVLLAQAVVDALAIDVGAPETMSPFAAGPLVGTTVVAGIGAAVAYAAMVRFTERPVRNFLAVSVGVFAFMLVPVALFTPEMGITPAGQGVLVLYHVLVAVPLVSLVAGAIEV